MCTHNICKHTPSHSPQSTHHASLLCASLGAKARLPNAMRRAAGPMKTSDNRRGCVYSALNGRNSLQVPWPPQSSHAPPV
eukprot:scaffold19357_cov146-Isochrysis_galbana.AAC.1